MVSKDLAEEFKSEFESIGITPDEVIAIRYAAAKPEITDDNFRLMSDDYQLPQALKTFEVFGHEPARIFSICYAIYSGINEKYSRLKLDDDIIKEYLNKFIKNKQKCKLIYEFILESKYEDDEPDGLRDQAAEHSRGSSQKREYVSNINQLIKIFQKNGQKIDVTNESMFKIVVNLSKIDSFWADDIESTKSVLQQISGKERVVPTSGAMYFNIICRKHGIEEVANQILHSQHAEEDSSSSKSAFKAIEDWINTPSSANSNNVHKAFKELSDISFFAPTSEIVHRGISVDMLNIDRVFTKDQIEEIEKNGHASFGADFTFVPKEGFPALSWSKSYEVAQLFTRSSVGKYTVIFTAKTAENKGSFFDLTNYYLAANDKGMLKEQEVISLDNIKIARVSIVPNIAALKQEYK
jgi:hypothetical protein